MVRGFTVTPSEPVSNRAILTAPTAAFGLTIILMRTMLPIIEVDGITPLPAGAVALTVAMVTPVGRHGEASYAMTSVSPGAKADVTGGVDI
jgi:hypothetical protein